MPTKRNGLNTLALHRDDHCAVSIPIGLRSHPSFPSRLGSKNHALASFRLDQTQRGPQQAAPAHHRIIRHVVWTRHLWRRPGPVVPHWTHCGLCRVPQVPTSLPVEESAPLQSSGAQLAPDSRQPADLPADAAWWYRCCGRWTGDDPQPGARRHNVQVGHLCSRRSSLSRGPKASTARRGVLFLSFRDTRHFVGFGNLESLKPENGKETGTA